MSSYRRSPATLLRPLRRSSAELLPVATPRSSPRWTASTLRCSVSPDRLDLPDLTLLLLGPAPDQPTAYAYVSSFGGIGPCAAVSPRDLPTLLAHCLWLANEEGRTHASFVVPGMASTALAYLLDLGGRFDASMTLLLSNRAFGHLNRYLLSASDALF